MVQLLLKPAVALLMILLAGGCDVETHAQQDGLVIIFSHATRWSVVGIVAGLLAVGGLGLLVKPIRSWAGCGMALVAVGALLFVPGYFTDRIMLTPEGIVDHAGYFDSDVPVLTFREVERVVYFEETEPIGRGQTSTSRTLRIIRLDGTMREHSIGTLWNEARPIIDAWLEDHGVRVGPDPRAFGMATDDPLAVEISGFGTRRLDAPTAGQRLEAMVLMGILQEAVREDGLTLDQTIEAREPIFGAWSARVEDGWRWVDLTVRFEQPDRLTFTSRAYIDDAQSPPPLQGTYELTEASLVLAFDGQTLEVMRRNAEAAPPDGSAE